MPEAYTSEALAAARAYFHQPEPRFWTFSDDAIAWIDGTTIVFHRELAEIMRRLALNGLPRLTPLLLLLAACRDSYRRERVHNALAKEKLMARGTSLLGRASEELSAALDFINKLPLDLRSTIDAKVLLVETVFQGRRFFPAEYALGAVELLRTLSPTELFGESAVDARSSADRGAIEPLDETQIWSKEELLGCNSPSDIRPHITSALLVMAPALRRLDAEVLRLRLRTGLEQTVEPAEIEPPEDESLRAFISRLRDDAELPGLGRLAHNLLAAVQVPRAVSEPEDLPLGGVSDIANRGPLDRLLVSELAQDDLTLAVRVAVGEALYLRREAPPRTPVRQRALLIDCGIRMWGVPRVFAAATGLALAATADKQTQVSAWRASANAIEAIELGTREGLVEHLEALEAAPQPAAALARFFQTIDEGASPLDAFLITHQDVLADADFRRALAELGDRQFFIATVERSGRFALLAHSGRGTKLIREAQFDLNQVLSPPVQHAGQSLVRQDTGSDLPVILSTEPFPLLLPHQVNFKRFAYRPPYGAVALTHDRRLMYWRQPGQGAAQLTARVPRGRVIHLSLDEKGVVRLVAGGAPNAPLRFLRVNVVTGDMRVMALETTVGEPNSAVYEQEVLYLIGSRSICAVGDECQISPALECLLPHAGRRFFSCGIWYALSFDGQMPQLSRVPVHSSIALGSIAAMFDVQGRDGPYVITKQGRVALTIDGKFWPFFAKGEISLVEISDDGQRLIVAGPDGQLYQLFLQPQATPRREPCGGETRTAYLLYPELRQLLRPGNLPRRFHTIGIDGAGRLTLVGRRGRALSFGTIVRGPNAVASKSTRGELRLARSFVPAPSPPEVGYRLRVAHWTGGSAWLDSRGLLHLKCADRAVPELTLVIVEGGALAAWSSDGRYWGPSFYTGPADAATSPGETLLHQIDAFITRLR